VLTGPRRPPAPLTAGPADYRPLLPTGLCCLPASAACRPLLPADLCWLPTSADCRPLL